MQSKSPIPSKSPLQNKSRIFSQSSLKIKASFASNSPLKSKLNLSTTNNTSTIHEQDESLLNTSSYNNRTPIKATGFVNYFSP